MENYLMLNGKRIDLTEEQIRTLGLEPEKEDLFSRKDEKNYFFIDTDGSVRECFDTGGCIVSGNRQIVGNYCRDKELMWQRALHETLNRLLWRFSMQNDGDKIDWNNFYNYKYAISYDNNKQCFTIHKRITNHLGIICFFTEDIAQRAINEIIKPFMRKYPEFVW